MTKIRKGQYQLKRLKDRFASEPTIENYVALREKFPRAAIPTPKISAAYKASFVSVSSLENIGLDGKLLQHVLDGDERAIERLCLQLMKKMIERRKMEDRGSVHTQSRPDQISDTFLDFLLLTTLEAVEYHRLRIPSALHVLLRDRLGGLKSAHWTKHERYRGQVSAILAGAKLRCEGREPSLRAVAKEIGVHEATISRWFQEGNFRRNVEVAAAAMRGPQTKKT